MVVGSFIRLVRASASLRRSALVAAAVFDQLVESLALTIGVVLVRRRRRCGTAFGVGFVGRRLGTLGRWALFAATLIAAQLLQDGRLGVGRQRRHDPLADIVEDRFRAR